MWHLAAFSESISAGTDTDVNALIDDILTIQNSHFMLREDMNLMACAAMSATLDRAKLSTPTMRIVAAPYVRPMIVGTTPGSNPNVQLLDKNPTRIPWGEEVQMLATAAPAGSEQFTAILWLSRGLSPIPSGNVIPVRWTSSTAAVANSWTTLTMTWGDTLPSGIYAMVQTECYSTNAIAHRWNFPNQLYRPGMLSFVSTGQRHPYAMSLGQFGVLGQFRSNALPTVQVLANGTDNAHVGYAHVVRLAPLT